MASDSLFLTFIRSTLKKWIGFQVALDEGMGGPYAREKEEWLGTEIENYFKSYNDVKPDELEDYVGTMLENEFDVYFEDGSLLETCKLFCKAYSLSVSDPDASIFQPCKELNPRSSKILNSSHKSEEIATGTTENNVEIQMQQLEIKDPEDEGWTVVNRKHKK